jgi:drug/metabolite transporter (DMT)-like permease
MNWFFISVMAPVFWSINTHFDKYILSRYNKDKGIESVFLFSTLFSILFSAGLFVFKHNDIILYHSYQDIGYLLLPGIFNALGFYFYLQSLKTEESSIVVALFQMTPVFAYILSYIILGEVLTSGQIFASILILIGASILSVSLEEDKRMVFKKNVIGFISLSALFFAANDVLFKKVAVYQGSFFTSLFWQHIGIFIIGIVFFILLKRHRGDFLTQLKNNKLKLFALNGANEFFYVSGNMISNLATLYAPVALVLVVNTYQTVFTFIIGTLLTFFLPSIVTERISRRHLTQKILAIVVIIIGTYFLYY